MGRRVVLEPVPHKGGCEVGHMFKSTLKDDDGNPCMFAVVNQWGQVTLNSIVFQGICDTCHQEFRVSYILESMLMYREVS